MADNGTVGTSFTWQYKPSLIGAIIGVVVFAIITIVHIFRFVQTRTKPCIPFIFAALNEAAGYAIRIPARNNSNSSFLYLTALMLLLISPMMAAGGLYGVMGRIIQSTSPSLVERSPMRPSLFTKVFGIGDMILMLMITVGATMASRHNEHIGKQVLLGGIGIHTVSLFVFTTIIAMWHRRVLKQPATGVKLPPPSLRWNMWAMYIACGTITLRNEARFAEFLLGADGFLQRHELPFYFYDTLPIVIALSACLKWYGCEDMKSYAERGMIELDDGVALASSGAQPSISPPVPTEVARREHGESRRLEAGYRHEEQHLAWQRRQSFGIERSHERAELA